MRTLEQMRAADALEKAQAVLGDGDKDYQYSYRAYVERLGPAVVMNGLGQAVAIERAAAGESQGKADQKAHLQLYENLEAWLCRRSGPYGGDGELDLLEAITAGSQDDYLAAHWEALAWLDWHKKFCQAYLPRRKDAEG